MYIEPSSDKSLNDRSRYLSAVFPSTSAHFLSEEGKNLLLEMSKCLSVVFLLRPSPMHSQP